LRREGRKEIKFEDRKIEKKKKKGIPRIEKGKGKKEKRR
jgi:hypothetical protein